MNKRGESNKFLLIVLLIIGVVILSNNGFFTGRATRYITSPEGTNPMSGYNPLQVRASQGDTGIGIVSQRPNGKSGIQYQTSQICSSSADCGPSQCMDSCTLIGYYCASSASSPIDSSLVGYQGYGVCSSHVVNCCAFGNGYCSGNTCVYPPTPYPYVMERNDDFRADWIDW